MNVAMLRTLVAIVDRGSFAAAAHEVGCTPSAVSLQVKQLEAWFGELLFDRSMRTVKPTPFALEAAAAAREVAARLEALRKRPGRVVAGRVRLGAIATVQTSLLPPTLRLLRDRHPALRVDVSLGDSDALLIDLKAGRIDAAVLVRPEAGGSSRLAWHDVVRQPFVMLVPPTAPLASPPALLQRHDLIRYDTALSGGRLAAQYVRRAFPGARCVMEMRSIDAIVAMVGAGLGVSIVPQPRKALLEAHGVREVSLGRAGPARRIALACRRADAANRNLAAVLRALVAAR
jgi:DNA-binding transcriptional LysR family regulator